MNLQSRKLNSIYSATYRFRNIKNLIIENLTPEFSQGNIKRRTFVHSAGGRGMH